MSSKAAARKVEIHRAPAARPPVVIAIERMAKLASSGASPSKMVAAVNDILIQWRAEEVSHADLLARVEQLQADLDAGFEAAEDFVTEAETPGHKKGAEAQVAALKAVKLRLAEIG